MMAAHRRSLPVIALALAGLAGGGGGAVWLFGQAGAGSLRSRVEGTGGDARVQFQYAARADVCGWGPSVQIGRSTFVSLGTGATNDNVPCRRGPVVVRVTRAGGQVVGVEAEVGPESRPEKGRRCADPGCTTVLSTYNASPTCYLHTMPVRRHALER